MAEAIFQQLLGSAEFGSQSRCADLVKLGMTVTVRGDLDAGGRQLRELRPRQHPAGGRPGRITSRVTQPSRRDEDRRRETMLDQHRQRFFEQVGEAIVEGEHDRARGKRLPRSATLAQFAERQTRKPLAP